MSISVHALDPAINPDGRRLLEEADIIFGIDVMSQRKVLAYGRSLLKAIAGSQGNSDPQILEVEIDEESDDLERLLGYTLAVKGHHDYLEPMPSIGVDTAPRPIEDGQGRVRFKPPEAHP